MDEFHSIDGRNHQNLQEEKPRKRWDDSIWKVVGIAFTVCVILFLSFVTLAIFLLGNMKGYC